MADHNFMLALMEAVSKDQDTLSQQQIVDAQSTELATKIETSIYEYWNGPNGPLANDVNNLKANADAKNSDQVTYWQQQYSVDSSKAQAAESQQDGAVQSGQGQTSSDASNLQMMAQMVQGTNNILTTLSGLLGRITA